MPKQKTPELADWTVSLWPVGQNPPEILTVRASRLRVQEDSKGRRAFLLEDASGEPVFASDALRYVKIKGAEDSEHVPARKELAPRLVPLPAAPAFTHGQVRELQDVLRKVFGPDVTVLPSGSEILPPADPITAAVAGRAAGSADPKPPLPKRTTGRRTGK